MRDLICVNYGAKRGVTLSACRGAWHGRCYRQLAEDGFPVLEIQDIEDSVVDDNIMEEEDKFRFKEGRDGDSLMTQFQCDMCHFQNVYGRDPTTNHMDELGKL